MQQIPMATADQAFAKCWRSAGLHLQAQGQGSLNAWLRAHLNKGPEWVVVRATRYPASDAKRPANWQDIAAQCSALSSTGHLASVRVANAAQNEWGKVLPLWKGQALTPSCVGLYDP